MNDEHVLSISLACPYWVIVHQSQGNCPSLKFNNNSTCYGKLVSNANVCLQIIESQDELINFVVLHSYVHIQVQDSVWAYADFNWTRDICKEWSQFT